jgi:energy-coupling factor transporter ATP-binding protein EcfA2
VAEAVDPTLARRWDRGGTGHGPTRAYARGSGSGGSASSGAGSASSGSGSAGSGGSGGRGKYQDVLVDLVDRIGDLADRARDVPSSNQAARRRTAQFAEHVVRHVRPRARGLDAPVLILLVGPTGAGKSSLFNALASRNISATGVLRPTTRKLVAYARPGDPEELTAEGGPLAGIDRQRILIAEDTSARDGVVLVDAPDVDSVEHANRELTDRLVEAADLAVFVTTATRYADRVPWEVLGRVGDRGLPLVVLVNRMPADPEERTVVLDDFRRLLRDAGLEGRTEIDLVGVEEGALEPRIDGLDRKAVHPLIDRIDGLAKHREARLELASRALAGSLANLEPQLRTISEDLEHAAIDSDRLRRLATEAFERELGVLRDELARGSFLRAEALRAWQDFVGADEITKAFSSGIGRVRSSVTQLFRGAPTAPVAEVREQTIADLRSLAHVRVTEAIRRAAAAWSEEPAARAILDEDPAAWSPAEDLDARIGIGLDQWLAAIGEDVRRTGGPKRTLAQGASVGVNAAGIGVMLATFSHTGGLTGAEVGIAAVTGFLNQRLLSALFGEAALVEMISRARFRLIETLGEAFRGELARFDARVPAPDRLRGLSAEMRSMADELRTLPPAVSVSARPVMMPVPPRLTLADDEVEAERERESATAPRVRPRWSLGR